MTQLATPSAVLGDFDDVELTRWVPSKTAGGSPRQERYLLSRRGEEYWVTWRGSEAGARELESRIVMTTGSHEHQLVWVWAGRGRELFHLPFTWLVKEKR